MADKYKSIKIEEYVYSLPDEKIAKYPLAKRDLSKLLLWDGDISHCVFNQIHSHLPTGSLMVFNNTKVIQARLNFFKSTGARIEVFCLEPVSPVDFVMSFSSKGKCVWRCIVGNQKKWKEGILTSKIRIGEEDILLHCRKISDETNARIIEFSWEPENFTFSEILENAGTTPIPPYLNRKAEQLDKETYQTVYSKHKGSVAAPTAGLHFTEEVLKKLEAQNIRRAELTLHVGAGTFKPVKSEEIGGHDMHTEHFFISQTLVKQLIERQDTIIAVGTTTVRTLESIYWLGVKVLNKGLMDGHENVIKQWETYKMSQDVSMEDALNALLKFMQKQENEILAAATQIIIVPGYKFRIVGHLITNFHQPRSTLLLLIAAFVGQRWKDIYHYALNNNFRFLSYGDSSLLNAITDATIKHKLI